MLHLGKKEKLQLIKEMIDVLGVKAYEIAKNTTLTESGIGKILNGKVQNPQERSLNEMFNYLNNINNSNINMLKEDTEEYKITANQEKLIDCLNEQVRLMKEISRLQNILDKNDLTY
jgi:predicted transcriptional regulator